MDNRSLIKLDPVGYPQISAGADLIRAACYKPRYNLLSIRRDFR